MTPFVKTTSELEQELLRLVGENGNIRFDREYYLTYDHEEGLLIKNLTGTKTYKFYRLYSLGSKEFLGAERYEEIVRIRKNLNEFYNNYVKEEQYYL